MEKKETSLVKINEIFTSVQGEGPYVGKNQLFIRFCNCNLNCKYCDTNFKGGKEFSPETLWEYVKNKIDTVHSISLTGGEPLLFTDFLKQFLPLVNIPVYLETNGTLPDKLSEIIDLTDIISADIKLPSSTGMPEFWEQHDKFLEIGKQKEIFAKIVFTENITDDEISNCIKIAQKHNTELILQPKTKDNKCSVPAEKSLEIFEKFLKKYKNIRLIPQVHKFLGVD